MTDTATEELDEILDYLDEQSFDAGLRRSTEWKKTLGHRAAFPSGAGAAPENDYHRKTRQQMTFGRRRQTRSRLLYIR